MFSGIDRYWFLTWTTYGTWLPGDERGFVSTYRDRAGAKRIDNQPSSPPTAPNARLVRDARRNLRGPPVTLTRKQAESVIGQLHETAQVRGWRLLAVAVMRNHVHIVVGVPGDPEPERILGDFKSYASRILNRRFGRRPSATWWTESGSRRPLKDETSVLNTIEYVRSQESPLVIWTWDGMANVPPRPGA